MISIARLAQALVAASLVLAPAAAYAGETGKAGHEHLQFPAKADKFNEVVEKRITKLQGSVDKRLAKANVTDEKRTQVKKEVATGVAEIRAAATKAEADGTVTKEEAKEVHAAAKKLHEQLKAELPHVKHAKK